MEKPRERDGGKPDHHDRPEQAGDAGGAAPLRRKQHDQDGGRERGDDMTEGGICKLEAFDRGEHRDRRRDHRVSEKHRSANDAKQEHQRSAPAQRAARQRGERERAAFPVVVRAQEDQHVFDGDHDDQRPQDQRQHAEYDLAGDRARSIRSTIDERLQRVSPFGIDLYQVHQPVAMSSTRAQMNALADLVAAQRIRAVGVSNFAASLQRARSSS